MSRGRKLPKVLTKEEQESLLSQPNFRYPTPHRNYLIMRFMLDAGLRASEVVGVKREHLNMLSCKLMVREGKGAKDRTLWISPALRDEVGEYLEREDRPASEWLFPTHKGTKVQTAYLRRMVKRYACKAEIPECEQVSPHTLRHTFATDLLRETGNIRLVQRALGHEWLNTTMIYTHIVDEELEDALKSFRAAA